METSASNPNPLAKSFAVALVLAVAGVLIMASRVIPGSAALQERIFENKIPAHIPIKIKVRKEKEESFKDFKNERWLSQFELEVTNTGDKPIYFLYIMLGTNVKDKADGLELMFPLSYGRAELGSIVIKATSDDVPIKPGEAIYLSLGGVPGWEKGVREMRWPDSNKFTASVEVLSFGDGTGYLGTKLYPPPDRPKAAARNGKPPQQSQKVQRRPRTFTLLKKPDILICQQHEFLTSGNVLTPAGNELSQHIVSPAQEVFRTHVPLSVSSPSPRPAGVKPESSPRSSFRNGFLKPGCLQEYDNEATLPICNSAFLLNRSHRGGSEFLNRAATNFRVPAFRALYPQKPHSLSRPRKRSDQQDISHPSGSTGPEKGAGVRN